MAMCEAEMKKKDGKSQLKHLQSQEVPSAHEDYTTKQEASLLPGTVGKTDDRSILEQWEANETTPKTCSIAEIINGKDKKVRRQQWKRRFFFFNRMSSHFGLFGDINREMSTK
ncbi:hypothetical protein V6N12_065329 [Hibiscus sabdariffa]|uniref:Uncharacterized protein n=1 Tax=Hibiscus sabdariffa TaxID=183260 RepID=A0ABR2G8D6_9ROSI